MFLKLTSTELKGVSCKKTKKQTPWQDFLPKPDIKSTYYQNTSITSITEHCLVLVGSRGEFEHESNINSITVIHVYILVVSSSS